MSDKDYDPLASADENWIPVRSSNTHPSYFECQCSSDEHTLKFNIDPEDGTIYTSVYLNNFYPWYHRVVVAIKYIFGYKSKFGAWDCTLIRPEDNKRLVDLVIESNNVRTKLLESRIKQNLESINTKTNSMPPSTNIEEDL